MNILYLITFYRVGDGSSAGLYGQIDVDKSVCDDYLVVTKDIKSAQEDLNIVTNIQKKEICDFIKKGSLVVHFFRGHYSNLLLEMLQLIGNNTPVVITFCQSPSYKNVWLTPFELKHAWQIVFIDKAAYNNKIVSFIPECSKMQIYLSGKRDLNHFDNIRRIENNTNVVYGRGSTSIKCPKNMFEVFDRIDIPNKLFCIVGIDGDSWIKDEAAKRDNVEVYGQLPRSEWEVMCNSFDVFLYQLPEDCHASLDGTLSTAMMLRKPVVYMGCEAPKERFHHGLNGFVANSVDEMVHYATLLGKDENLRKKIGEAGRESCINDFKYEDRVIKYQEVYKRLTIHRPYRIPISYVIRFFINNKQESQVYLKGKLREWFPIFFRLYKSI